MTRQEKKEELIGLFAVGAIFIGDLIDECIEYGQQHPHWISVADELPKEYEDVLVYGTIVSGKEFGVDYIAPVLEKGCPSEWRVFSEVTHWMPLPAAPVVSKSGNGHIIGTAEHIKVALDVLDKKGGEK